MLTDTHLSISEERPWLRRRAIRTLSPLSLLLILLLGLLCGCRREFGAAELSEVESRVEYSDVKSLDDPNMVKPRTDAATGQTLAPETPGVKSVQAISNAATVNQGGVGVTSAAGRLLHLNYYDGYSHIYWRLNWIRKAILSGSLPGEFARNVAITRKELEELTRTIQRDGNYTSADEALTHLEHGLEHIQANQALLQVGANTFSAPWSSGREMMQNFIDQGKMGFGGKPLGQSPYTTSQYHTTEDDLSLPQTAPIRPAVIPLSSGQRRALSVALEYAEKHHAAPLELMRSEWKKAIEQINRLRDQLWLMNRSENSDGNASDISFALGQTPTDTGQASGGFSNMPLYDRLGTDLPVSFGKEPADPFVDISKPVVNSAPRESGSAPKPAPKQP